MYYKFELPGVSYIETPREPVNELINTIRFYCSNRDDEKQIKESGRIIAEKMRYVMWTGQVHYSIINGTTSHVKFSLDVPTTRLAQFSSDVPTT